MSAGYPPPTLIRAIPVLVAVAIALTVPYWVGDIQPGIKQAGDDADLPRIACRSATTEDQRSLAHDQAIYATSTPAATEFYSQVPLGSQAPELTQ